MGNPKRILLIEDNKHDQYFFIQALKEVGSAVLFDIANNGKEALDKLTSSDELPDLIFTDLHMPVMDGVEYLSKTAKMPMIRDIPVVVLSSDLSRIGSISDLGARLFIEKPDDCNLLQKMIEFVLEMKFMTGEDDTDRMGFQFIRFNFNTGANKFNIANQ